jgi:ABC-2 type transport system permease protein
MTVESIGPVSGGTVSLLAVVSGTWFPATGFLHSVGEWLPSYWLVQAGRLTLGGQTWGARGWAVVAAWTLGLAVLAAIAYRRDTGRV